MVGLNGGSLTSCYATGSVTGIGSHVGGLVGSNGYGTLTDCFWDTQTCLPATVGVGDGTSTGVTGKTTAEMKTVSTFLDAGWDLIAIWNIEEGQIYPLLRKYLAVDTNYDNKVDFADFAAFADNWLQSSIVDD